MSRARTWTYSHGRCCPICKEPITNNARFCYWHTLEFKDWLAGPYGRRVKLGQKRRDAPKQETRAEIAQRGILALLADQNMTTKKLARELGYTEAGIRRLVKQLADNGSVRRIKGGYRTVWGLAK